MLIGSMSTDKPEESQWYTWDYGSVVTSTKENAMPAIFTTDGRYHGDVADLAAALPRKTNLEKPGIKLKLVSDDERNRLSTIDDFDARAEALKSMGQEI